MRLAGTLMGALACMALALPAAAQDKPADPQEADAVCLAFTALLAGQSDEKLQAAGTMGTLYYIGKLKARDPDIDLTATMRGSVEALKTGNREMIAKRCGMEFQQVGDELRQAGAALKSED
ncbi:hypothetical protein [Croceicoccus mobilis]|uniref:Uncharacterized protein n=1 Tax=Croceicoccus mobilis TaxID=1703339 RepID=A0A916YTR8_9SPHN|nr:hypothetical protein [Croceicoccus mobilis]GGD61067.1 hypothetical protein GCM10010990_08270 [Croceicoccus mobilis]